MSKIFVVFSCLFLNHFGKHKGVGVVPAPDGVLHRDSHYRSQLIGGGGLNKFMIFIRGKMEEISRIFLGCFCVFLVFLIGGRGWSPPPMGFGIRILIVGANL